MHDLFYLLHILSLPLPVRKPPEATGSCAVPSSMEYVQLLRTAGRCCGYSLAGVPPFANVQGMFATCDCPPRRSHTYSSSSSYKNV